MAWLTANASQTEESHAFSAARYASLVTDVATVPTVPNASGAASSSIEHLLRRPAIILRFPKWADMNRTCPTTAHSLALIVLSGNKYLIMEQQLIAKGPDDFPFGEPHTCRDAGHRY